MSVGQSRKMSAIESCASVAAGYILNVLIQFLVYPIFGIDVAIEQALVIAIIITGIAFVKNFSVRRLFNYIHLKTYHRTASNENRNEANVSNELR